MVWYSYLFKNFPVCCDPHKGFGIVDKADVVVFQNSSILDDLEEVGNLISGFSALLSKSRLNLWKFMVHILLKSGLEDFKHYFASM